VRLALETVQNKQRQVEKSLLAAKFSQQHRGAAQLTVQAVREQLSGVEN
jgi:hypothetical protein